MSLSWKVIIAQFHEKFNFINIFHLNSVYSKKVQAATHQAEKTLDLKKCNYVGLKIPLALGQQETFEFVVSIENCDVVTFSAKTW